MADKYVKLQDWQVECPDCKAPAGRNCRMLGEPLPNGVYCLARTTAPPPAPPVLREDESCFECGTTEGTFFGPNPCQEAINHDDSPVWRCERCYQESQDAI